MKHFNNHWLAAAMCAAAMCLGGQSAQAVDVDDYIFIEELSIAPGESKPLTVWANTEVWWDYMFTKINLPKGLVIEKLDPAELDPELFTLNYLYYDQVNNPTEYVALSTDFTNSGYQQEDWYQEDLEYEKKTGLLGLISCRII